MNTYTVYDNDKLLATNIMAKDVSKLLNIRTSCLSRYSDGQKLYKGRYKIIGIDSGKPKTMTGQKVSDEIINDWNENMMVAAQLIRTGGGRIVTRRAKGKKIRYTEVI